MSTRSKDKQMENFIVDFPSSAKLIKSSPQVQTIGEKISSLDNKISNLEEKQTAQGKQLDKVEAQLTMIQQRDWLHQLAFVVATQVGKPLYQLAQLLISECATTTETIALELLYGIATNISYGNNLAHAAPITWSQIKHLFGDHTFKFLDQIPSSTISTMITNLGNNNFQNQPSNWMEQVLRIQKIPQDFASHRKILSEFGFVRIDLYRFDNLHISTLYIDGSFGCEYLHDLIRMKFPALISIHLSTGVELQLIPIFPIWIEFDQPEKRFLYLR